MKIDILEFDKPTVNNRIYKKENINFPDSLYVYQGQEQYLSNIVGVCENIKVENNCIVGEFKVYNTPMKFVLEEMLKDGRFKYTPSGIGKVDKDGIVTDYNMKYINVGIEN